MATITLTRSLTLLFRFMLALHAVHLEPKLEYYTVYIGENVRPDLSVKDLRMMSIYLPEGNCPFAYHAKYMSHYTTTDALKVGFYHKTCPHLEDIVHSTTYYYISRAPTLAAPLLRMHFHDCFVRGCDGSVLLKSTANNQAERDAIPNQSLRGFQVIDAVKSAVEKACPGVVSCADILALVARDAVLMLHGPFWEVPTGRRDGRVSIAFEALTGLPPPFANITQLKGMFASKGLTVQDLVVLSGGHTIGSSHCSSFSNRLYNFTGKEDTDPKLDKNYVAQLKLKCKPGDAKTIVEMDPGSFKTFDEDYYTHVAKRRGLFQSDAALLEDYSKLFV